MRSRWEWYSLLAGHNEADENPQSNSDERSESKISYNPVVASPFQNKKGNEKTHYAGDEKHEPDYGEYLIHITLPNS